MGLIEAIWDNVYNSRIGRSEEPRAWALADGSPDGHPNSLDLALRFWSTAAVDRLRSIVPDDSTDLKLRCPVYLA
jgi:hypothetical protein